MESPRKCESPDPEACHGFDREGTNTFKQTHRLPCKPSAADDAIDQIRNYLAKYLKQYIIASRSPSLKGSGERIRRMGVLDGIEKTDIRNLLGKGWLTHDGMWFYHTCRELGIRKANEINKGAIKSMAPIEMDRMKRLVGITREKLDTFDGLVQFMLAALELTLPDSVSKNFEFTAHAGNLIRWKWESLQCFAYKGMKQIGVIDGYRCGVMYRIECWLEALGVKYSMRPVIEGCLMHEKGRCEGEIQVFLSAGTEK